MDTFPLTDEQIRRAYDAAEQTTVGFDLGDIREILRGFHEAGITVDIPVPRYDATKVAGYWEVWRYEEGGPVVCANFSVRHHPDPKTAAMAHADWLSNPEAFAGDADYFDVSQERDRYRNVLKTIADMAPTQAGRDARDLARNAVDPPF